jgi:hypothetical protein
LSALLSYLCPLFCGSDHPSRRLFRFLTMPLSFFWSLLTLRRQTRDTSLAIIVRVDVRVNIEIDVPVEIQVHTRVHTTIDVEVECKFCSPSKTSMVLTSCIETNNKLIPQPPVGNPPFPLSPSHSLLAVLPRLWLVVLRLSRIFHGIPTTTVSCPHYQWV